MVKVTSGAILTGVVLAIAALTIAEYYILAMPVLPNRAPMVDPYGYSRSALTAFLAWGLLAAMIAVHARPTPVLEVLSTRQWLAVILAFLLLALFAAIFLISPSAFSTLGLEDGIIEWASALLPLLASAMLAWRGASLLSSRENTSGMFWVGCALIVSAVILFVLGMEEISWMQRVFGIPTPENFSGNIQDELNLHNFATNEIGAVHKIGGFVVLILLPFLQAVAPGRLPPARFADLAPSRTVALTSAPLAACNYNGWDSLLIQMTSYLTIGIIAYFALMAWRAGRLVEAAFCVALALLIVGAQLIFLGLGDRFIRIWDVTEYKELFIALGLMVWAREIFHRMRAFPFAAGSARRRSSEA